MILADDGYEMVPLSQIVMGDVAIYRRNGEIIHSGLVLGFKDSVPFILSKWGELHEVVHRVNDCDYAGQVTYYRIVS